MDLDQALQSILQFDIRKHCHVNTNEDGDRFVGIKADSDNAMVYFPIGYQLPETDAELRTDIKHLIQVLSEFTTRDDAVVRGGVKDRAEEVRRFQNDDDCRVFIGQIAAAGLGITLTAASTMVFYSLDYSMSNFDQAKARIHRVGQCENCHYIYLIARGTVDRKILRSLRDKIDLAKTLVDDYRKGKNPFRV